MKKYDIVLLTDYRYIAPTSTNQYIENILFEDKLVYDALLKFNLNVVRKSWDDANFDWSTTKYALFRATWDYFERYEEFAFWFKTASKQTTFINSKNCFKGLDFVLKPCIAGGARHTYKFNENECDKYESIFKTLIAKEAMMLQEFQKNVVSEGEISMMVFNGEFTHAVLKIAKPGDFRVQDDYGGTVHKYKPSKEQIDFALATVNAAPELPIYGRVDIFRDNQKKWALAELEIFEPELWFRFYPEAAKVLAKNIHERLF